MADLIYKWKRYWVPRNGTIVLSEDGFLYPPDAGDGDSQNPDAVFLKSVSNVKCVILLGENGIGKTNAMSIEKKEIDSYIRRRGGESLWLDLRKVANEDALTRSLFQSPAFRRWKKGKHTLHLFLDSLDVALLRMDAITQLLTSELDKYRRKELCLRIACRTAAWPRDLEDALHGLMGEENVKAYELAPLQKNDVIEAVRANKIDPEAFLSEVARVRASPFAIKPLSLGLLIKRFKHDAKLGSTKDAVYLDGCRCLCQERTTYPLGNLRLSRTTTADQRLAIASRIAAVSVFANRNAVWTNPDEGDMPKADVPLRELAGGTEHVDGSRFDVTERGVWETLDTGLFSGGDADSLRWSHQSYAEFLAARYAVQNHLTVAQTMSLIVHPTDQEGRLVPQLQETAAWLASMDHSLFNEILRADPKALFLSDIARANDDDRAALVKGLLELFDQERLLDTDRQMRRMYSKLAHANLADQLRPYIRDKMKGVIVRRVAIDIAEACNTQNLQQDLVDVALDVGEENTIRVNAGYAVTRVGNEEAKKQLKPLALGNAGDDPDDQLKGVGLMAAWPLHMTTEELFRTLTPPKKQFFVGAYQGFLSSRFVDQIPLDDLPVALKWIESQPLIPGSHSQTSDIEDAIMLRGWDNLGHGTILPAFASAAKVRLKSMDGIVGEHGRLDESGRSFRDDLSGSDSKRRQLALALLPLMDDFASQWVWLLFTSTPVILEKDVPWMVEQLNTADTLEKRRQWALLIESSVSWYKSRQLEDLISTVGIYPPLVDALQNLKKTYAARARERRKWAKPRRLTRIKPSPRERIEQRLTTCEQSDSGTWWLLNREMTLEPTSEYYGDDAKSNLTSLPGWKSSDKRTKERIVAAAKKFLVEQDPEVGKWLGTNTVYFPALSGYRALELLLRIESGWLKKLPKGTWKKWAPVVPTFPNKGAKDDEIHNTLLKLAYSSAPDEVIQTILVRISQDNANHGTIFLGHEPDAIWDDKLAAALFSKLDDESLTPDSIGLLLRLLLSHQYPPAREYARSLLALSSSSVENERLKAQKAASALMLHDDNAGWVSIWPKLQSEANFGMAVVTDIADLQDLHGNKVAEKLTEDQLADLYIWLEKQFPHAEDPEQEGFHAVSSRETISWWRDGILRHLRDRKTQKASQEIQRIAQALPHLRWLRWVLIESRESVLGSGWSTPSPRDIIKLAVDHELLLVRNGSQLLSAIQDSLARLQRKLQGENTGAQFLWNENEPKNEAAFSDFVKMHLEDDLVGRAIFLNREAQIHRAHRTDIHVDAASRRPEDVEYKQIKAIIEAKGCWNRDVNDAMKTQLVETYLAENDCRHGLYLVGWFICDSWTKKDRKRATARRLCGDLDATRKRLEGQARQLSVHGLDIRSLALDASLEWTAKPIGDKLGT